MTKTSRRDIALICLAFLLCGALRILLWSADFADLNAQLFCGIVVFFWIVHNHKRVTDMRILRQLDCIACFFLLYLLLQCVNYRFAQDQPAIRRYAWYGYYISMTVIAVLIFYVSLFCYADENRKIRAAEYMPAAAGGLITAAILSNDLHFLAWRFTAGEMLPSSPMVHGPVYYLYYAVLAGLLVLALITVIRKNRAVQGRSQWLLLGLPVLVLFVFYVLDAAGFAFRINGHKLWQKGETFCFCLIAFLEMLTGYGLIPVNIGYEQMFAQTDISAAVLDNEGKVRYVSMGQKYPFPRNEDTLVIRHPISGGNIEWMADVAPLHSLNNALEETVKKIDARNDYLSTESRIKQEKTEAETRNRIYDKITRVVRPQLDQIGVLLKEEGRPFDSRLRDIAVLSAYIKRRSNLELLSMNDRIPSEELNLAIAESLSYVQLKGVPASATIDGSAEYPAGMVIAAYEQVEGVIEDCLDTLEALAVHVRARDRQISVRMMIKSDDVTVPLEASSQQPGFAVETSASKNGTDMILGFTFRERRAGDE